MEKVPPVHDRGIELLVQTRLPHSNQDRNALYHMFLGQSLSTPQLEISVTVLEASVPKISEHLNTVFETNHNHHKHLLTFSQPLFKLC